MPGRPGPHTVIFRLAGDRRRYQHTLELAAGYTWPDVSAALATSYGCPTPEIQVVVVCPVAAALVRAADVPAAGRGAADVPGATLTAVRPRRRKLISTDTAPDDWPRDADYLDKLIARLYDRRSRARKRKDPELETLMSDRLDAARALRAELLLEQAVSRPLARAANH